MITAAHYEQMMESNKENKDYKNAIKDTISVLKEYGYDAGANILVEMLKENGNTTDGKEV